MISSTIRSKAISLRKKGYSLSEISHKLGIAQSTASVWLKDVIINGRAEQRLLKRSINGRARAIAVLRKKRTLTINKTGKTTVKLLGQISLNTNLAKLLCSVFIWTEGGKIPSTHTRARLS